jgi:hypothetical protein
MNSSSAKRGELRCCDFDKMALGDLAVSKRVDVCPLLLKRTARQLDEASLVT